MSHSKEPVKSHPDLQDSSRPHHYFLTPSLHPHGWKLTIQEEGGPPLFRIIRYPTVPPFFKLRSLKSPKDEALKIKSTTIEDVTRYSLVEKNQEQLSIRSTSTSPVVFLRNQQRKTIGHFLPISPEIILLRTPNATVAHLRLKEKPPPLRFQIECEIRDKQPWLFAVLLYSIFRIEVAESVQLPQEKSPERMDDTSSNT
ncbi:MAG: hypothetical protein ACFFDU_08290 [Candidatus Thorarchaeota archaeon]